MTRESKKPSQQLGDETNKTKDSYSENGGRPPHFETPEELEELVQDYFDDPEILKKTITGLALYLGFCSRQSFYDYEKRPRFSYNIKKARLRIEEKYEEKLDSGSSTGAIFALKQFGWKDKSEVEQKSDVTITEVQHVIIDPDESK